MFNYEHFYDLHEGVKALDRKIATAEQNLIQFDTAYKNEGMSVREIRTERQRLAAIVNGLKEQRIDIVGRYNADSRKTNRTAFKANDLPYQIEY